MSPIPIPSGPLVDRRAFGGLVFAGYAAAALAASAEPIVTSADGLAVRTIRFAVGDGSLSAYFAAPRGASGRPVILVLPEIWGLHAYIADVCRRLASQGYVAIAPDLFARAGDPAPLTDLDAIARIVATASNDQVNGDLAALLGHLSSGGEPEASREAFGVTGFCWGGAAVWMACAEMSGLRAGVAWYGRLAAPPAGHPLFPEPRPFPIDVAGRLRAPVLGLYAEIDEAIPLTDVARMRAALGADSSSRIQLFAGARHGFHADYRDSYDAEAAEAGWRMMLDHFARNGLAP